MNDDKFDEMIRNELAKGHYMAPESTSDMIRATVIDLKHKSKIKMYYKSFAAAALVLFLFTGFGAVVTGYGKYIPGIKLIAMKPDRKQSDKTDGIDNVNGPVAIEGREKILKGIRITNGEEVNLEVIEGCDGQGYPIGAARIFAERYKNQDGTIGENVIEDPASNLMKWTSSNPEVAEVNKSGWLMPVSEGNAVISAEYEGYLKNVNVHVVKGRLKDMQFVSYDNYAVKAETIVLEKMLYDREAQNVYTLWLNAESEEGKLYYLTENKNVKWELSNENVVALNEGRLVAIGKGTVTIKATFQDKTAEVNVTVKDSNPVKMDLSKKQVKFNSKGMNEELHATAYLADGSTIDVTDAASWITSDQNVVTVYNGGLQAEGNGKATITVKFRGFTETIDVTVGEDTSQGNSTTNNTEGKTAAKSISKDGKYEAATEFNKSTGADHVVLYDENNNKMLKAFEIIGSDHGFIWSPDNKKVCVTSWGRIFSDFSIIDAANQMLIEHPTVDDIVSKLKAENIGLDYELRSYRSDPYLHPIEWSPDSKKLLIFYQWTDTNDNVQNGIFVYNTETNAVSNLIQNEPYPGDNAVVKKPENFSW